MLVDKMYAWRKYAFAEPSYHLTHDPNRIALVIYDHEHAIATATLGLDSEIGLLVDELYRDESETVCAAMARHLCEMTKLAVEHLVRSKRVLASLFHISLIYARHLHERDDCLIEINPRHVKFYEAMLGFESMGEAKMCRRVECARAIAAARPRPRRHEDRPVRRALATATPESDRSIPYFFSKAEEAGILGRLESLH